MLLLQVFDCRQDALLFNAEAARLLAKLVQWTSCQVSVHAPEHAWTACCGEWMLTSSTVVVLADGTQAGPALSCCIARHTKKQTA